MYTWSCQQDRGNTPGQVDGGGVPYYRRGRTPRIASSSIGGSPPGARTLTSKQRRTAQRRLPPVGGRRVHGFAIAPGRGVIDGLPPVQSEQLLEYRFSPGYNGITRGQHKCNALVHGKALAFRICGLHVTDKPCGTGKDRLSPCKASWG